MTLAVTRWRGAVLTAGVTLFVGACDLRQAAVIDPKGPIALAERNLLFDAFCVMMGVIVPVIVLTLLFAEKAAALFHARQWHGEIEVLQATTGDEADG